MNTACRPSRGVPQTRKTAFGGLRNVSEKLIQDLANSNSWGGSHTMSYQHELERRNDEKDSRRTDSIMFSVGWL